MSERYGTSRIRASVSQFLTGKAVSSLAGFVAIILIVKALSVAEFAAYSVLIPLEDILASLSALGLTHAILRYVPELYAQHYQTALLRFVAGSVLLRLLGLLAAVALAYVLSVRITGYIGLDGAERAYEVFLLIVVPRSCGNFVSLVLESGLHQASAQAGHVVATLGRLGGIVWLMRGSAHIGLVQILQIEVAAETLGLGVMLAGLARMLVLAGSEDRPADDRTWGRANLRRVLRFALSGYVQHLTILLYGTPNRLVGGHFLAPAAMAAYGFCSSAIYYLRRYLPAQLLMGVIRPVIVARYTQANDFSRAVRTSNLVLKVNAMLVGIVIAYIPVAGERTILTLTGGKYGAGTMLLLLTLAVHLLLDTQRQLLEVLVQAVEQYHLLIPANILLSASILPAVAAVPAMGAIALPLSNVAGLVLANYWVVSRMRSKGFPFRYAWGELLRISAAVVAALGTGLLAVHLGAAWWAAGLAVLLAYFFAMAVLCRQDILDLYRTVKGDDDSPSMPKPFSVKVEEYRPPHIVFGILSSRDSSLAIAQIADCVRPHRLIVHHDYSKCPQFTILRDNISVLPTWTVTAWGGWSLVDATLKLMAEALKDPRCTHFQLLSESCLPIHGIAAFERFLEQNRPDAMIDLIPVEPGSPALASHGWRYLPRGPLMRQVARRASIWWLGTTPGHRQETSVDLHLPGRHERWAMRLRQSIGRAVVNRFQSGWPGAFPMGNIRRCWVGGQWFAVSRAMAEHIISIVHASPQLIRHFSQCHIPDEAFIHTVVAHSGSTRIYPGNHVLFWDGSGMGPDLLELKDVERVRASGKFFARKLPLDPASPVRQTFLPMPGMRQAQTTP